MLTLGGGIAVTARPQTNALWLGRDEKFNICNADKAADNNFC